MAEVNQSFEQVQGKILSESFWSSSREEFNIFWDLRLGKTLKSFAIGPREIEQG